GVTCLHLLSFLFHGPATTHIYSLSLHDALPIYGGEFLAELGDGRLVQVRAPVERRRAVEGEHLVRVDALDARLQLLAVVQLARRSEEHTSELQSLTNLVCRLLLEKKN